eukprot:g16098.t1
MSRRTANTPKVQVCEPDICGPHTFFEIPTFWHFCCDLLNGTRPCFRPGAKRRAVGTNGVGVGWGVWLEGESTLGAKNLARKLVGVGVGVVKL